MRITTPAFGLISGAGTALGFLPHVLTLCILLVMKIPPKSVTSLVVFTIAAKLLGEWLFWGHFQRRMDSEPRLKNWRLVTNQALLSHPNVYVALLMMFADFLIDITLVYTALKTPISPTLVFLFLLGCQIISAPIQGVLSDYFSQKKSLLFATFIGMLCIILSLQISPENESAKNSFSNLLSSVSVSNLTIILLCVKGLLGNLTVIARAAIAEVIKVETLEKVKNV